MAWREEFYKAVHKWLEEHPNQVIYVETRSMYVKDVFDDISHVDDVLFEYELEPGHSCCDGSTLNQYVEIRYCGKNKARTKTFYFHHDPYEFMAQLDD